MGQACRRCRRNLWGCSRPADSVAGQVECSVEATSSAVFGPSCCSFAKFSPERRLQIFQLHSRLGGHYALGYRRDQLFPTRVAGYALLRPSCRPSPHPAGSPLAPPSATWHCSRCRSLVKAAGVNQATRTCGNCTVSVTVARRRSVIGGVTGGSKATSCPLKSDQKYFVSSAQLAGSKSPRIAIDALFGVELLMKLAHVGTCADSTSAWLPMITPRMAAFGKQQVIILAPAPRSRAVLVLPPLVAHHIFLVDQQRPASGQEAHPVASSYSASSNWLLGIVSKIVRPVVRGVLLTPVAPADRNDLDVCFFAHVL